MMMSRSPARPRLVGVEFIGSRLRITTADGKYEGIVHSLDLDNVRVTLEKVVCGNGKRAPGLYHFFGYEIKNIEVLEDCRKKSRLKENDEKSVLHKKNAPRHLKKLVHLSDNDFNLLTADGSSEGNSNMNSLKGPPLRCIKSLSEMNGSGSEAQVEKWPSNYLVIDSFDENFQDALDHITRHSIIGVAVEGVQLGRHGKLAWIQMGTRSHVFVFDVLTLGKDVFEKGLGAILQCASILKVTHDCRQMSDILHHQYGVSLVNVFDTQVADVMIYRMEHKGTLPRYVTGLSPCLITFLNLSREHAYFYRQRESTSLEDQKIWLTRPAPQRVLEVAVRHTMYLVELRARAQEALLREFTDGVDIYLSSIRDSSDEALVQKEKAIHLLPREFRYIGESTNNLGRHRSTERFQGTNHWDDNGFRENCQGVLDSAFIFSHDSIWHKADPAYANQEIKRGTRLQECHNMGQSKFGEKRSVIRRSKSSDAYQSAPETSFQQSSVLGLGASMSKRSEGIASASNSLTGKKPVSGVSLAGRPSPPSVQVKPAGLLSTAEPSERYVGEVGVPFSNKSRSVPGEGILRKLSEEEQDDDEDAFDAIPSHKSLRGTKGSLSDRGQRATSSNNSSDVEGHSNAMRSDTSPLPPALGPRPKGRGIRAPVEDVPRPGPTPPQSLTPGMAGTKTGLEPRPSISQATPKTPTAPVGRAQLIALLQQSKIPASPTSSLSPPGRQRTGDQFSDCADDTSDVVASRLRQASVSPSHPTSAGEERTSPSSAPSYGLGRGLIFGRGVLQR